MKICYMKQTHTAPAHRTSKEDGLTRSLARKRLARARSQAENEAKRRGLVFGCEWEMASWEDLHPDVPRPREVYWCFVARAEDVDPWSMMLRPRREALASRGMVGCNGPRDPLLRTVASDLFIEALQVLDSIAQEAADDLVGRPTLAAGEGGGTCTTPSR